MAKGLCMNIPLASYPVSLGARGLLLTGPREIINPKYMIIQAEPDTVGTWTRKFLSTTSEDLCKPALDTKLLFGLTRPIKVLHKSRFRSSNSWVLTTTY